MLSGFQKKLPDYIRFLFLTYITGIFFFTSFRLIIVLTNLGKLNELPVGEKTSLIFSALLMGFRFDSVISGYILTLPVLVLGIMSLTGIRRAFPGIINTGLRKFIYFYTGILYTFSFLLCCVDIPFFNYYFSRLNTSIFNWADEGRFMAGMVLKEFSYLMYLLLFAASAIFYWYLYASRIKKALFSNSNEGKLYGRVTGFVIMLLLVFVAVRGRLEIKSPIRAGTAFFSSHAFPNQLGLNPVFTFIRSYLDDIDGRTTHLRLVDDEIAIKYVRRAFGCGDSFGTESISRLQSATGAPAKMNVILVLMESMSAGKMSRYGGKMNLTPFLDSLAEKSMCFDNNYSSGIHTYSGVFSSLYAFPSLMRRHPMKVTRIPSMTGLPVTLKEQGYSTLFFTTHDEQFDNMSGFMYANGIEKMVSQKDFPQEWVLGPTGVPDHILFSESIQHLNAVAKKGKPFFAAMLTASDHGPYNIPEGVGFKARTQDIHTKVVEYADWSIRGFMEKAKNEPWFDNTVFIFTADHGAGLDANYNLPLSYVHTPLIVYSKKFNEPKVYRQLTGQIDIYPAIMSLLNISFNNSSFGMNAFEPGRKYMYFSADEKIGCISDSFYYLRLGDGREGLYSYRTGSTKNESDTHPEVLSDMREYAFSMMQCAQNILERNASVSKMK